MKAGESLKYRRNKVKREHGIIQKGLLWLENLGRLSEVTDIIPGVIDVSHSSERGIVFKYETQTGCKLLLKSNGSVQEVFVVTKDPTRVQEWVKQEFPPDSSPSVSKVTSRSKLQSIPTLKLKRGSKNKTSTSDLHHLKKRSYGKVTKPIISDKDSLDVANCLDRATLKALGNLKQSLENHSVKNKQMKCNKFLGK